MKKTMLSLLIISSLMLASCAEIDGTIKIEDDFSLTGKINIDTTDVTVNSSETSCELFNKYKVDDYDMIEVTECIDIDEDNGQLSFNGLSILDYVSEKDGLYTLNLITFLDILDGITTGDGKGSRMEDYNYKLDFSNFNIVENSIGKVNNNILEFGKNDIIRNSNSDKNYVTFTKKGTIIQKQSNPQLDKELDKLFIEIDKKGEEEAKKVYNTVIKKIDSLINKTKNSKNKKLLNYIKDKVLEKLK